LLLDETVRAATRHRVMKQRVALAAIDGTGFESRHISTYFVKRRAKGSKTEYQTTTYTRYPAANVLCDCTSHLVLSVVTRRGPGPDDPYFRPAVEQAARRVEIAALAADAGYDSEAAHDYARGEHGIRTLIPATRGRPTTKRLKDYWRQRMRTRFNHSKYRTAMAGGNGPQSAQALPRLCAASTKLLVSVTRNPTPSPHTQHHDYSV
jgi:hypothetical protein